MELDPSFSSWRPDRVYMKTSAVTSAAWVRFTPGRHQSGRTAQTSNCKANGEE